MRPTSYFTYALVALTSIQSTVATPTSYTSRDPLSTPFNKVAVESPALAPRSVADILQAVAGLVQGIIGAKGAGAAAAAKGAGAAKAAAKAVKTTA